MIPIPACVLDTIKEHLKFANVETFHYQVDEIGVHKRISIQIMPYEPLLEKVLGKAIPDYLFRVTALSKDWKDASVEADVVNHPSHYNSGKIEVIEFIEDQRLNYHLGNTVKYICRAGKKDPTKEIEDLEKAQWYLLRRIEELKALKEGRAPVRPNEMKK